MWIENLDFVDVYVTNLDAHLKSYALGLLARLALGACLNLNGANLVIQVHQVGGKIVQDLSIVKLAWTVPRRCRFYAIIIVCGRAVIFFDAVLAAGSADTKNDMCTDVLITEKFYWSE